MNSCVNLCYFAELEVELFRQKS